MRVVRRILAVLAGVAAAMVMIMALQIATSAIYPPPPGIDWTDPQAKNAYVASMPLGAFLLILVAYAVGSLIGGLAATAVSDRSSAKPAIIVGVLLTATGASNLAEIHHPLWFAVTSTLVYVPFAWLGARVLMRTRPAAT